MSDGRETPWVRVVLWGVVCAVMVWFSGLPLARSMVPAPGFMTDFFQDWASANYFLDGKSIYAHQGEAARAYLGHELHRPGPRSFFNEVNAHPPASVLLVLPVARLDYPTAQLTWTLFWLATLPVTVGLVLNGSRVSAPWWSLLMWIPLLLWCTPLGRELFHGQIDLATALPVAAAWRLGRSGRPWLAGACVGIAASVKALPLLLLVYYACDRRWAAVAGGVLSLLAINGATALVFGVDAYRDYATRVVPFLAERYKDDFANFSLTALCSRLFAPPNGASEPILLSPALANGSAAVSRGLTALAVVWGAWAARTRAARDHAFGATLVALLLLSPITWSPYCLLLILPGVLLWRDLSSGPLRALYWAAISCLWVCDILLVAYFTKDYARFVATPFETLTVLAAPTYALLVLFGLSLYASRRADSAAAEDQIHGPAAPDVRPAGSEVGQEGVVAAPGVLQGVREDRR